MREQYFRECDFAAYINPLLGENVTSLGVGDLLKMLKIEKPPKVNPETETVYISRKEQGFSLLFKEPATIKNPAYSTLPKDLPVLTGCFLYSEGHDGFTQFAGPLPGGLVFSDNREQAAAKLGNAAWKREKNGRVVAEKWEIDGRSIHLTYRAQPEGILVLSLSIPQNF